METLEAPPVAKLAKNGNGKEPAPKLESKPVIVKRSCKHMFTRDERDAMNTDLLNSYSPQED